MTDVVVFGASGATGRVIVDQAVRAGHRVTAAVRDPARFAAPDGVDVCTADVRDAGSVRAALDGHRSVISAVGPPGRRADGLYSAWATAVTRALPPGARVVALSSAGVRPDDPALPRWYRLVCRTVMREVYRDMAGMERVLAVSGLEWTVVRPARIVDGAPDGPLRVCDGGLPPGGRAVTRGDLARFVVHEFEEPAWSGAVPTVAY